MTVESEEVIRELMVQNNGSIVLQLKKDKLLLERQSLLIFGSNQDFLKYYLKISYQPYPYKRIQHLLYIVGKDTVKDAFKTIQIGFVVDELNILTNVTDQTIDLITLNMYTNHACRKLQVVTSNQFKRSTMTWDHDDFYPNKYKNMFGCPLIISTHYSNLSNSDSGPGVDPTVLLAKSINASIRFIEHERNHFHFINNTFDLMKITFPQHIVYEFNHLALTHFIASHELVFIIPLGELYTPIEKMFLPFDTALWRAVIGTLTTGLVVIQVLNQTPMQIQNFCYGRNIRTPTVNMISIVLNGGQFKVPFRNFSRFLFVLFVWWSLIMRTCYQSETFKNLQADPRKPQPTSIQDMEEKNFCIHAGGKHGQHHLLKVDSQSDSCLELIDGIYHLEDKGRGQHRLNYYLDIVAEPDNKFAVYAQKEAIDRIHHSFYRSGYSSLKVMKNFHPSFAAGYALKMQSPFNSLFNDIVLRIFEAGIFVKDLKNIIFSTGFKRELFEAVEPQILTMEHLDIGFKLCSILLIFSSFIFLLECLPHALKKGFSAAINNVVLFSVVVAYMNSTIIHM